MASNDALKNLGFEKSKIGSGDKEVGYQIKESSLSSLVGSVMLCFLVMGALVVVMVYDIKLEKKTLHRQVRQVEHTAASKLARVQMELWSQYRDDVQESKEAQILLKQLESSSDQFKDKFQSAVNELAQELNLPQDRSAKFADKILHLVADMQADNVKHSKHLLDHLVNAGKRGKALEKHVDKDIVKNAVEERKRMQTEGAASDEPEGEKDPLHAMLKGFWTTFSDYEGEFGGKVRTNFMSGSPIYDQVKELHAKVLSDTPLPESEISTELDKIDLGSAGAPLGAGRVLPAADIVEELALIPVVPFEELKKLKKDYDSGKKDAVTVFARVEELHSQNLVPSGWLQLGVDEDEKEEEEEEEREEKENDEEDEKREAD